MRILPVLIVLSMLVGCFGSNGDSRGPGTDAGVENRGAGKDDWFEALPRPEWALFERVATGTEWFEVYRVEDGVYAIYEPGQFEEVISFLIVGEQHALLFDTGLGIGDIRAVVRSLTDLEVTVLNSHGHYDHIGGNYQFGEIIGRDTAFSRERAAGSSVEDVAEFLSPGWVWKPLPEGFDPAAYRIRPYRISSFVSEGTKINLGGRVLEVLVTPGHAPDAICLIDRDHRLLFVGDTFYLAPLYTHVAGADFATYAASAARLAGLAAEVDQVMTAHNVPVVPSRYLLELDAAFTSIRDGKNAYIVTDGFREYDFGDFSVIVGDDALD